MLRIAGLLMELGVLGLGIQIGSALTVRHFRKEQAKIGQRLKLSIPPEAADTIRGMAKAYLGIEDVDALAKSFGITLPKGKEPGDAKSA